MNTIIEKIRAEIERLMKENSSSSGLEGGVLGLTYEDGINTALNDVLEILDTIKEQPVELEKEIEGWFNRLDNKYCRNVEEYYGNDIEDTARHFAKWQKEQMLKEAVEGEIQMRYSGCLCAKTIRAINEDKFKLGDKIRLIIVKED